jgi:NAD(P)H-hydrate epimerase
MKLRPLSREEVRDIDREAAKVGLSTLVLMENAGRGAADLLRREIPPSARIAIVCGRGNNGGDGAVMARHLDAAGYSVRLLWFMMAKEGFWSSSEAQANSDILVDASGVVMPFCRNRAEIDAEFAQADWIVDGLFGTGLNRPVDNSYLARDAIEAMNASGKPILAIDIPSGLDTDTGEPLGVAVKATITATFVAPKLGFGNPAAALYTGRVEVVEIGVPRKLLEEMS